MKVAPSVLTADFSHLKEELDTIRTADYIHLDIMDGHFVPNISFGPAITKTIAKETDVSLDVHLMVTHPANWVERFALQQTRFITIHVEAHEVEDTIDMIRNKKIGVGLSIKPKTKVEAILPYLQDLDLVLVMTVEPGFGGQSFMADMLDKVRALRALREEKNLEFLIEVDGGISDANIDLAREAGVDIVVAGSYIFNQKDRAQAIRSLK